MKEEIHTSLVRKLYEDFETGDLDLLRVVMADEVVWHEPGRSALAADYHGPEAVLAFLGQLRERSGGTFSIEVLDVLSEPGRAIVFMKETASKEGRVLEEFAVVDFEIHHQKVTEVTVYHGDMYHFDDFFEN